MAGSLSQDPLTLSQLDEGGVAIRLFDIHLEGIQSMEDMTFLQMLDDGKLTKPVWLPMPISWVRSKRPLYMTIWPGRPSE